MDNKTRMPRLLIAIGPLFGLLVVGIFLYLFRSTRIETAMWVYELQRKWGSIQEVRIDINKDGVFDFVGRYKDYALERSSDDPLVSATASSHCNGVFDVQIHYEDGRPVSLEFDSNNDGISESYQPKEGYRLMEQRCKAWEMWISD